MSLAWSHPAPGDVDEYVVEYRCPSGSGSYTEDARPTVASEVVSGLTNGVECDFRVAAEDVANNLSAWAGPVQATPEAEMAFVSLAESTLWGTSGTLANIPSIIGFLKPLDDTLPLPDGEFTTTDTTLGSSCSSDSTTFSALIARINAAADRTEIVLPPCTILAFHNPDGDVPGASWDTKDYVKLVGTPGLTEIEVVPDPAAGAANWDPTAGDVNRAAMRGNLFVIGPSDSDLAPIDAGGCPITQTETAPAAGEDTFDMGCDLDLAGSGGLQWGAGDVMRFTHSTFANAGATTVGKNRMMTRLLCVRDKDGEESGNCTGVPAGNNKVRTVDPVLTSFATATGTHFAATPTDLALEQLERVGSDRGGVGTDSNRMAEYIGFEGITFKRRNFQQSERRSYVRATRVADMWFYNDQIEPGSGAPFSFKWSAGRILFFMNTSTGPYYANTCFGKILSLARTNPVQLTVQSGACCGLRSEFQSLGAESGPQCPDKKVGISPDANIAGAAGNYYSRTIITPNLTSSGTTVLSLDGFDGTSLPVEAETPGGTISAIDDFGMGYSYTSTGSGPVQYVNNAFADRRSPFIIEAGGYGHYMFANYDRHSSTVVHSRTEFPHGNSGAPGTLFEKNDTDGTVTIAAQSNGAPSRHGEGVSRLIGFNRLVRTTPSVLTNYGDTKPRGTIDQSEDDDQDGFANEDWAILGNIIYGMASAGNDIDNGANDGSGSGSVAPYLLYKLRFQRNRAYSGEDLDDNFDFSDNPSTIEDVAADELSESVSVPTAYVDERAGLPHSFSRTSKPWWWCDEAVPFHQIGAHWDDGADAPDGFDPLPAKIVLVNETTCTHSPRADGWDFE